MYKSKTHQQFSKGNRNSKNEHKLFFSNSKCKQVIICPACPTFSYIVIVKSLNLFKYRNSIATHCNVIALKIVTNYRAFKTVALKREKRENFKPRNQSPGS